jgi:hypothetical protein
VALSLTGEWGRRLTRLALAVGLLLLVAAPVLRFWVTPVLAQSPEVPGGEGFLTHVSTGTITTLFDLETAESTAIEPIPVTRTESTRGDATGAQEAAAAGVNAAVTNTTDRTETGDGRLIAESEYRLAADRRTQALVDCCGVQVGGVTVPMTGSGSPLRLPWFTPEEPYPYFDLTLLEPSEMSFIGPEDVGGVTALKFQQAASPTPIGTVQAPGVLVGSPLPTVPLVRTHVVNRTIWVDPTTGIILRKVERIREALRDSAGKDIVTLLAMTTSSTPEQVDAQVALARDEGRPVLWTHSYGPLLAVVLGLGLITVGLVGVIVRTRAARVEEDFPDQLATFEDLREAFD